MGNLSSHNWPSQRKRKREEEESAEGASTSSSKRAKEESAEGASTSSSISPEATGVGSDQYVFLSFRGPDTRKEFTDHLYHGLNQAGIKPVEVFKDDKSISIGEKFPPQIFNAIERSKISIPIISKNYALSKWCLRELIAIMERKNSSSSHTVLPIFYKIAPSDVRRLNINSGWAFPFCWSQKRFNEEISQRGRQALEEVSRLQGWESSKFANGHEGELIRCVVETVQSKLLKDFQLDIPKELVGLDGPLMNIMNWIRTPSVNARMIGIYGMGGIGKTTLAKCIYDQCLGEFKHASFLPNIREKATPHDCMKNLQSQLINDILKSKCEVSRIDDGINIIKFRFKKEKVLIILDDIDDKDQLDVLARNNDWFSAGSMIIVTTRNEAVLVQSEFKGVYKYEMKRLDEEQSLLLFNRHAFREDPYQRDLNSISRDIISTMDGLPLALQVVGSYLYRKNPKVWEDLRRQLQSQPHEYVKKSLRISYDALEDGHKQIFLDIACFFIGYCPDNRSNYMMCMWEGCGLYPIRGIEELKLRCLIKIGKNGELEMHDQLRDLGRSIFCQEQLLEERSGPWADEYEGVPRVLRQNKVHDQLRDLGECLCEEQLPEQPRLRRHDTMKRFDDLIRAASRGDKEPEVRLLQWSIDESDYSLSTTNLHLRKLVVLHLGESEITKHWEGWSLFKESKRLRALDLANCRNLRSTPDLSAFTQLKILNLSACSQLEHLHPSIAKLKSLVSLDLRFCRRLMKLPKEVRELKDLEELYLGGSGITQIPPFIRSLRKLKKLETVGCKLREIPSSIGDLQNLEHLEIGFSELEKLPLPSAIGGLKKLQTLIINFSLMSDLPESIRNLSSLQRLDLSCRNQLRSLSELPSSLTHVTVSGQSLRLSQFCSLIHLEELNLRGCHLHEDIDDLPPTLRKLDGFRHLEELSIYECSTSKILDLSKLVHLKRLEAWSCYDLVKFQGLDNLEFLDDINIWFCDSINNLLCLKSRCLKRLTVIYCNTLVEIQGPLDGAKFLEELRIEECGSLETLPDLTGCEKLQSLTIRNCEKLTQLRRPEKSDSINCNISGCNSLK